MSAVIARPGFLRTAWLVTRKDLTVELRSREIVYTTLFFAVSCVLVFAFGFVKDGRPVDDVSAAILWIAIAFSGTLALGRTFERERASETLQALMLAPADRPAIYAGKLLGIVLLLGAVELVVVPLVALLFQAPYLARPLPLVALLVTGTLGFAAVGTLFAALLAQTRLRDLLLPVLFYPVIIPLLLVAVLATGRILSGETPRELLFLVGFDLILVTASVLLFDFVAEDPS